MTTAEPPTTTVRLTRSAFEAIQGEAAKAYPHEGCGALLGSATDGVEEALPLPNTEEQAPRTRFVVSARDYIAVEDEAESRGLKLLGFWHSHPDHPARPSATDRKYAWEGLLTFVIAVEKGQPRDLTAWDVPGLDQPFRQLDLSIEPA